MIHKRISARFKIVVAGGILFLLSSVLLPEPVHARVRTADGSTKLSIRFDYRYANNWFTAESKKTLEAAADVFARLIQDDFPAVPKGTVVEVWNYHKEAYDRIVLDQEIDDLIIFVTVQPYSGGTKAAALPMSSPWTGDFITRYTTKPFRPWAISVWINETAGRPWFFDQTPETEDDIPSATHHDFFETVLHELGHGFGLIRNESPFPFTDLVRDEYFYGSSARSANNNQPVRLENGSSHIHWTVNTGLPRPDLDRFMMHWSNIVSGFRAWPSEIDLGMLRDIGYSINDTYAKQILERNRIRPDSRATTFKPKTSASAQGVWYLDNPAQPWAAIRGYPLRYVPTTFKSEREKTTQEGTYLPPGSWLLLNHGLAADGGSYRNTYSLVMDVWLYTLDRWYALYNTNFENDSDAEAWISPEGRIGQRNYSSEVIKAQTWHRIILVVDLAKNQRRYYVDGALVLSLPLGGADGQFSLYTRDGKNSPLFVVAGDKEAAQSGGFWLWQVGLFGKALSDAEAQQLGKAGSGL